MLENAMANFRRAAGILDGDLALKTVCTALVARGTLP
jgi:hypothetical protein